MFQLIPPPAGQTAWAEHFRYRFQGADDGGIPLGPLSASTNGALFGTTSSGGSRVCKYGTVFRLSLSGNRAGPTITTLHTFHGLDGAQPVAAPIAVGGSLFGTTVQGGTRNRGAVYTLTPACSR